MNIVLIAAWGLAAISAFFVHPDGAYLNYPDYHTLGLLFCLMCVMAGLQRLGVFSYVLRRSIAWAISARSRSSSSMNYGIFCAILKPRLESAKTDKI